MGNWVLRRGGQGVRFVHGRATRGRRGKCGCRGVCGVAQRGGAPRIKGRERGLLLGEGAD